MAIASISVRKSDGMLDLTDWGRGRVRGEEHLPSNAFLSYGRRDEGGSWVFFWSLSLRQEAAEERCRQRGPAACQIENLKGGKKVEVEVIHEIARSRSSATRPHKKPQSQEATFVSNSRK